MSIGLFPKRVYVPILWSSLTDDLQHSLLRHEVAHIKRKDGLLGALQILAQAIYFFHPLVWILTRQADELREMACDDMAVDNSEVTPLVYSRCLVHVAEHMLPSWSCSSASTLMKQKNKLYHRVNYQVKETDMKKIPKHRSRLIWALLLVLVVPLSWYCKQEQASPIPPPIENSIDAPPPPPADYSKIYGTVMDAKTGEAIPGANIILEGTNQGAATDMNGNFVVSNVLPGDYALHCRVIGYRDERLRVSANGGQSTLVNFKLNQSFIQGETVTVTASNESNELKAEFIAYDEPPTPIGGGAAIANNLVYPEEAKNRGIEGMVIVQAFINKDGTVDETLILRSDLPEVCGDAAQKAIRDTKFEPAKQRDKPVGVWITIPIQFKLDNK
jgi:TonB family protein